MEIIWSRKPLYIYVRYFSCNHYYSLAYFSCRVYGTKFRILNKKSSSSSSFDLGPKGPRLETNDIPPSAARDQPLQYPVPQLPVNHSGVLRHGFFIFGKSTFFVFFFTRVLSAFSNLTTFF